MNRFRAALGTICLLLLTSIAAPAQNVFTGEDPWPCPEIISPLDLEYDGYISHGGLEFVVRRLYLSYTYPLTTVWGGSYNTYPREPVSRDKTKKWVEAIVNTSCTRVTYIDPWGVNKGVVVVRETSKSGRIVNNWGSGYCDDQRYIVDPEDCEDPEGGDGGGGGGSNCSPEFVRVDVYDPSTGGWRVYWEGTVTVCS